MKGLITLSTDFGLKDSYVGTLKGVILSINSRAKIVSITQEISPYNIASAAYLLKSYYSYFPKGTIHLIVVDPGVGTGRQAILAKSRDYYFIAPNNGLLTYVTKGIEKAVSLTNSDYFLSEKSHTFHGRDIFAPVAAHLSKGVAMEEFGQPFEELIEFSQLNPEIGKDVIKGKVIHIDRFGNLVTNITKEILATCNFLRLEIKGHKIRELRENYMDGKKEEVFAIFGSLNHLEISANCGSAKDLLSVEKEEEVLLYLFVSKTGHR